MDVMRLCVEEHSDNLRLVKIIGGSIQQLLRRLNLLYHHSYLERPRAQLDYDHAGGSKCVV